MNFKRIIPMLLLGSAFCANAVEPSGNGDQAYLFSYFKGNGEDGLHLAYSYDGLSWTPLNSDASFLRPKIGKDRLMRDPSICQGPDGTYHMVWTSGWWDKVIGYASSKDLIHWSNQKMIPVMAHEKEAKNSWAPEVFYDDASGLFYILWATTIPGRHSAIAETEREKGLNHRIYFVTTRDFNTFSAPRIYFNPDFSAIDASIVREPWTNKYMMLVKNENPNPPEKNIRVTCTDNLADGFPVTVSAPITGNYWAEGPAPLLVGDTLYVYFDKYTEHKYGAVSTTDGVNWKDISDEVKFPKGIRHGTAFAVPVAMLENLINYKSK